MFVLDTSWRAEKTQMIGVLALKKSECCQRLPAVLVVMAVCFMTTWKGAVTLYLWPSPLGYTFGYNHYSVRQRHRRPFDVSDQDYPKTSHCIKWFLILAHATEEIVR
jgi:hypothetical protein